MSKIISELQEFHAANENHHDPLWVSEVPDDWSHTISVTSDQPVMIGKHYIQVTSEAENSRAKHSLMSAESTKAA